MRRSIGRSICAVFLTALVSFAACGKKTEDQTKAPGDTSAPKMAEGAAKADFGKFKQGAVGDVTVTPRSVNIGQIGKGESASKTFSIKVAKPEKIKITSVGLEDERFELAFKSGNPAGDSEYEVKFKGVKELERISEKITVAFEGSDVKFMEVPLRVHIVGDLRYFKDILFTKKDDAFVPREIVLSTRSGNPVEILGVSDPDKKVKTKILEPKGAIVKVLAEVADPAANYDTPEKHKIVIKTTDKDEPVVEIGYMISSRAIPHKGTPGNSTMPIKPI